MSLTILLRSWRFTHVVSSAFLPSQQYWEGEVLTLPGQRQSLGLGDQAQPISDCSLLSSARITADSTCSLHLKCNRTLQLLSPWSPNSCHSNNASQPPQDWFGFDLLTSRWKALQSITNSWGQFILPGKPLNISFPFLGKSAIITCKGLVSLKHIRAVRSHKDLMNSHWAKNSCCFFFKSWQVKEERNN